MILYGLSAVFMAITALLHSYFGEKRLLGPLFAAQTPFFEPYPRRRLLRTSWHYQSVFMLSNAVVVLWPGVDARLKLAIGVFWLVMGLQSLIRSRGKHVGVVPLLGAGLAAIAGAVL
jgi:hypothetical protein